MISVLSGLIQYFCNSITYRMFVFVPTCMICIFHVYELVPGYMITCGY